MPRNRDRRCASVAVAIFALTGLAACSTVESIDVSKGDPNKAEQARAGAYLNYAVAKSMFTITVAAAPSSGGAPGGGGQTAAVSAPSAGGAAAPTTWTLSGTLTAGGASPGTGTGADTGAASASGKAQSPPDATECGVFSAEYANDQTRVGTEISTFAALGNRLALMAAGKRASGDTQATLAAEVQTYVTAVNTDDYKAMLVDASAVYATLLSKCPAKVTVNVQQVLTPDTARTFALKGRTNVFYTDALTFNADANGFLTSGAPVTSSQVGAMASAIASDVGDFIAPTNALAPAEAVLFNRPKASIGAKAPEAIGKLAAAKPKCPGGTLAVALCELTRSDDKSAPGFAGQVLANLTTPGALRSLPAAALPITIYASIGELEPGARDKINKGLDPYGVSVALDCSQRSTEPAHFDKGVPENPVDRSDYGRPTDAGVYDGLVVSASRACRFQATQTRPGPKGPVTAPLAQSSFWAQDSRYLAILPTQRGFLVARSVTYQFANGQATGVTDSRPSEALALVSLPGAVVGSFFSGIATAFSDSQSVTTGKTGGLTAQTNYLTAQTNYLAAKTALQKAQAAAAPASGQAPN